jgi:hypothetical protein
MEIKETPKIINNAPITFVNLIVSFNKDRLNISTTIEICRIGTAKLTKTCCNETLKVKNG